MTRRRFCSTIASWGHVVQSDRSLQLWSTRPSHPPYHTTIFPLTFSPSFRSRPNFQMHLQIAFVKGRPPPRPIRWIGLGTAGRQTRVTADSGPSDLSLFFFLKKTSNTNPPILQSRCLVLLQFGKTNGDVSSYFMFCHRSS